MDGTDSHDEIVIRQLTRHYRVGGEDVHALRGVDLDVRRGEFLGVVGVSGSGKSTLLHLIGGLDTPTTGTIIVGGQDLSTMTAYQLTMYRREFVGFIFQSFYLVPNLTAEANIRLALTLQGTYGRLRQQLAAEALDRVGLASRARHRPGQLSGGEQQRVTVARAIVHQPRLLLADEPTGNLDRKTATSLMELIRGINRDMQTTVIMVTHDELMASRFCDRTIRMKDGCWENGSP